MPKHSLWSAFRTAPPRVKLRLASLSLFGAGIGGTTLWLVFSILQLHWGPPASRAPLALAPVSDRDTAEVPAYLISYELRGLSVPLVTRSGSHTAYAQFTLVLDCPSEDAHHVMVLNHAKLLDTIYEVASAFYLEDFKKPTGLESFKGSLLAHYRAAFKKDGPRALAIRDWLMN